MKEMIYSATPKKEVLHSGEYKGHKFTILNLGTHPTAYVECKLDNCNSYGDERLDEISVHGGFTYHGQAYWDKADKTIYLGWDYAHSGDYMGYYMKYAPDTLTNNKRWTTGEIFEEVKYVIDQLIEIYPPIEQQTMSKEKQTEGKWRDVPSYGSGFMLRGERVFPKQCSICGAICAYAPYPYCPECGAKMKGGAE